MENKSQYSTVGLFIRSSIFSIFFLTSIFFYSFACVASLLVPLKKRHALLRSWLKSSIWALEKICGIRYEVHGLENLRGVKTGVVLSKHQSAWETIFLPLIFHDPAVITKRELLWVPFFGWGLMASDPISINRSQKTSAMQQIIRKGKKCLDDGRWVLIFPEGTRIPYGKVGHYRLGGARLAAATGYPIIPVAHNAGLFWPKRKFLKIPGTVHIVIGPPIESVGKTPEELLESTKGWIESTMMTIESFVDKPSS